MTCLYKYCVFHMIRCRRSNHVMRLKRIYIYLVNGQNYKQHVKPNNLKFIANSEMRYNFSLFSQGIVYEFLELLTIGYCQKKF